MKSDTECTHMLCQMPRFDNTNECIFHCEKNESNGWLANSSDKYDKFNSKVIEFWREFVALSNQEADNASFRYNNFVIPFYHQNLASSAFNADISKLKCLRFNHCTFVDVLDLSDLSTDEFWIYGGKISSEIRVFDSKISKFALGDVELGGCVRILRSNFDSIEIDNIHSLFKSGISIESSEVTTGITASRLNGRNFECVISDCSINSMEFNRLQISRIEVNFRTKIQVSAKISDSAVNHLSLEEALFDRGATMFIEKCVFHTFSVHRTVNNCDLIGFTDVTVKSNFSIDWFEGKKFSLNKVSLKDCEITIENSNLSDIMLSSVDWGDNLSRIQSSPDIIRQIKTSYDRIGNHAAGNSFYAEEMKRYRQDLKTERWISNRFQEKFIFHMNGLISNFGQSYMRPIFIMAAMTFPARILLPNTVFDLFPNGDLYLLGCYNKLLVFMNELTKTLTPLKALLISDAEFGSLIFALIYSILLWHTYTAAKRHSKR